MKKQELIRETADTSWKWIYQAGGISAIMFGIGYIIIIGLYIPMGARPNDVESWLIYMAENVTKWWIVLSISVLTDFLLIPIVLAVYSALKDINKNMTRIGAAFVILFIFLDLALTWTNYASGIALGELYTATSSTIEKENIITAATYPFLIVRSNLLFVYNSLTLGVGIFMTSAVMLKGIFSKATAYTGLLTGFFTIGAIIGSFLETPLTTMMIIFASLLTTIWYLMIGFKLYKLGQLRSY